MPAEKDKPETWCRCVLRSEGALSHEVKAPDETCPVHTPAVREKRRLHIEDLISSGHFNETFRDVEFTCDCCGGADDCEFAFDPYNTDGDCLAEK